MRMMAMTTLDNDGERIYNTTMMLRDAKWRKKLPNH